MEELRDDFPLLRRQVGGRPIVYLDSAATSLKPQSVIDAVTGFYTECTANVHRAVYSLAEEATELYEGSRRKVARFLGADEPEVVFVRGTTEAINIVHRCYPGLRRCLTTSMEHHSNFLPWAFASESSSILRVDAEGRIDLDELEAELDQGIDLVAIGHVSNAMGTLSPIEPIIERARARGALVLIDAAQSAPHIPIDVKALDVDFLACSAHKMCGPGGVGVLYAKQEHLERMSPWLLGGHIIDQVHMDGYTLQPPPHCFEAGTPAIEATIGWGAAVDYLSSVGMERIEAHDNDLVAYCMERLRQIGSVTLSGPEDPRRRCGSVTFNVEGLEAHGVARMLSNRANILVRSGFHCAQPLHESLELLPTVRASFYLYNTREEVDQLAECLESITSFL